MGLEYLCLLWQEVLRARTADGNDHLALHRY